MNFLQQLLENTTAPAITAFILGLMASIGPCTLATNITAVGYVSKDLSDKRKVFFKGLFYTLGRAISYSLIGLLLFLGIEEFGLSTFLQNWGEKILGPFLILLGILMSGLLPINFSLFGNLTSNSESRKHSSYLQVVLLGMLFALGFCPYTGVLFFGMLIPITISSANGLYLPVIFAVATGIPVILFSWLIAYSAASVGKYYNRLKALDFWFRKLVAILFIGAGIYLSISVY